MQDTRHQPKSIEVRWTRLDFPAPDRLGDTSGLSATDRERAARFRRMEDRVRFVVGRRMLITLLKDAGVTVRNPFELAFTEHHRPYLPAEPDLAFSISHAGGIVAVALAQGARVGLDVESLHRPADLAALAPRVFSSVDLARFRAFPAAEQPAAFFRAWTAKEGVLKARGVGLFGGLQEIPSLFEKAAGSSFSQADGRWRIHSLELPQDYLGCVVTDAMEREISERGLSLAEIG